MQVDDVMEPQILLGTLVYHISENAEHTSSRQCDLSWRLKVPLRSLLLATQPARSYEELLASGQLSHKSTLKLHTVDIDKTLDILTTECRLVILERIEDTAVSLYGCHTLGNEICLLMKMDVANGTMNLEGKCNSDRLLENLLTEISELFSNDVNS